MRKTTKIYKDIPSGYPLSLHGDCPMAASCLRQLAYRRHEELGTFLNLINPSKCSQQADCPHYVSNQPVRFAKGFVNIQKLMYPEQYAKFMTLLICHFGRNQYFKPKKRRDCTFSRGARGHTDGFGKSRSHPTDGV